MVEAGQGQYDQTWGNQMLPKFFPLLPCPTAVKMSSFPHAPCKQTHKPPSFQSSFNTAQKGYIFIGKPYIESSEIRHTTECHPAAGPSGKSGAFSMHPPGRAHGFCLSF